MRARTGGGGGVRRGNDAGVLVLTSLASGPRHGHALLKDIEGFAGVTLGPGSLYGAISRLEERGLIAPAPVDGGDTRRQPYRLTPSGRAALEEAVRDMQALAEVGEHRLGLGPRGAGALA